MDLSSDLLWRHLRDVPAFRALLRATEAYLYLSRPFPRPVLDLGCGDGHFGAVALPSPPDVGLDPQRGPLREAVRRNTYRLLLQADGCSLPFPDDTFGTVVSNCVLEHIPHVGLVLKEVARVLRAGGYFYFTVPGPDFLASLSAGRVLDHLGLRSLGDLYRRFFDRISRHYYYDDVEGWWERLGMAGLRMLEWRPYLSLRAMAAVEWGHYFGLPSLVAKKLTGRWVICPSRANLWLTERLVRPFYEDAFAGPRGEAGGRSEGVCLFVVATRD